MSKDMLQEFLADGFFKETISHSTEAVTYVKGRAVAGAPVVTPIDAIVQVVNGKELIDMGLGQYTDKENYSIFMATEIDESKNNYITYQGKTYKIIDMAPWRSYGFRKYIMTQYNEDNLNDN